MSRAKKAPRKAPRKTTAKKPTPPKPAEPKAEPKEAEPKADEPTPEQVVAAVRQMRALPHETLVAVVQLLRHAKHHIASHDEVTAVLDACKGANTIGTLADVNGLTIEAKPGD